MKLLKSCALSLLFVAGLWAQEKKAVDPLAPDAVQETLTFIASDAMAGRDTPSPGLERMADWLAEQLKTAGIAPGAADGSYFHRYTLDGQQLDTKAAVIKLAPGLANEKSLVAESEFRLWRGGAKWEEAAAKPIRLKAGEPAGVDLRKTAATSPIFVEVTEDSPLWAAAAAGRTTLGRRSGRAGAPIFLVKAGVLPDGDLVAAVSIADAKVKKVELKNVVGKLVGTTLPDEYVLYSAHYDHIGLDIGKEDMIFNGADDDGTGTTAVLQIARAMGTAKPQLNRSMLFVFFSAEEKGLLGSTAFANDPPIDLKNVIVNLNIEMLGRPPADKKNQLWVTGRTLSDFESVVSEAAKARDVGVWAFQMEGQLFTASDNHSLAKKGVVAHSISSSELHPDYHGVDDEVDRIDFASMTKAIATIHDAGLLFNHRDVRPAYNEKGKKLLKLP